MLSMGQDTTSQEYRHGPNIRSEWSERILVSLSSDRFRWDFAWTGQADRSRECGGCATATGKWGYRDHRVGSPPSKQCSISTAIGADRPHHRVSRRPDSGWRERKCG